MYRDLHQRQHMGFEPYTKGAFLLGVCSYLHASMNGRCMSMPIYAEVAFVNTVFLLQ